MPREISEIAEILRLIFQGRHRGRLEAFEILERQIKIMLFRPGDRGRHRLVGDGRQRVDCGANEMAGDESDRDPDHDEDRERDPFVGNVASELGQDQIGKEKGEKRAAELEKADKNQRQRQDDIGPALLFCHRAQSAWPAFVRPVSTGLLHLKFEKRELTPFAFDLADVDPDADRAHPFVESCGVWIRLDLDRSETEIPGLGCCVLEQDAANAAAHRGRHDPQMIEMKTVVFPHENIKTHRSLFFDRDERDIRAEEFRPHRKDVAPGRDPALRITPIPFRRVRDFSKRLGVFRLRAENLGHSRSP